MHRRSGCVREGAGQDDTGKSTAAAEIDPDLGCRRKRPELKRVGDVSGPETFSYRVSLNEEQELVQINETTVEVFLSGGFPSFTITAKPASDAIGTAADARWTTALAPGKSRRPAASRQGD